MPRSPRPKPEPQRRASRRDDLLPPPTFRLSWIRDQRQVELGMEFHTWWCELCRQSVLVPRGISSRALDAYFFEHRQRGCTQHKPDGSEAG